ncbi:autotransporter domain-containing protein [Candidatus Tisiphia endosymbiont of Psammoecus bipunctatus]|uniref:autotransporter domain-containing protein n=1 Tax=Candidatus Tisiphia endosymbiont of Psammoecus bipunctatus TaxID=3139333 RepID=UPI0035C8E671
MTKKQKFFKNLLASSAIASVVASLGSSGVALAAPQAVRGAVTIQNAALTDGNVNVNWHGIDNIGQPIAAVYDVAAVWNDPNVADRQLAITYGGNHALDADHAGAIITAINLANHQPGILTVSQNLSIGSIVRNAGGANTLPIKIVAGHTAILTGTPAIADNHGFNADPNTYTGLGDVELGGNDLAGNASTLVVRSFNNEDIAVGNVSTAVHQQGVLTFETGGTVRQIGANNFSLATVNIGARPVTLGEHVWADNTNLTNPASVLNVRHNVIIHGNVVNTSGAVAGELNFLEDGRVTGTIGAAGANHALATVNIGAGALTLDGNVWADNTNLTNPASILHVGDNVTITGNVVNTSGAVAGELYFLGNGRVTGTIGATNALTVVNFGGTGTGVVELQGAANATSFNINNDKITVNARGLVKGDVTFNGTGTLNADAGIEGNVNFKGNDGIITLGAGQRIDGNVDNNNVGAIKAGILNFAGVGEVTRNIGATHALAEVNFGNAAGGGAVQLGGTATARRFNINNAAADVTVAGLMKGNVTFNADGTLNVAAGIRGNVTFNADGTLNVAAGIRGNVTFNADGTLNVAAGIRGNVHFNSNAGTINLAHNNIITGAVTASGAGKGILNFAGVGEVTRNIGATHALAEVNFGNAAGGGAVQLGGTATARRFNINNAAADVTVAGLMKGNVTFNADGTLNVAAGIRGNVHFNSNAGTINLAHNNIITGAVTASGAGKGILNFAGVGEVTGDIGTIDAANPANNRLISQININGANDVTLRQNVYTNALNFTAAGTVKIGGNFRGEVNFDQPGVGAVNGTLEFDGVAGPYDFDSTIANGDHGTLNVHTNLTATNAQIGKIKTINIGTIVPAPHTLKIDASNGNVNLLGRVNDPAALAAVDQTINFLDADSVLHLYSSNAVNNTITFADNLPGGAAGHEGIVLMEGNGVLLTVESVGGKSLGIVGQELKELQIKGPVTIAGGVANGLDVHETDALNIMKGAIFTDKSTTSAQIANIHIGADPAGGAAVGPANYILDAEHIGFNLNAHAANQIVFDHADAQLTLRNSAADNKTITLVNNLNPGADGKGIVELYSAVAEKTLTIAGGGKSLGIIGNNLKKVIFSGAGKFDTRQITIHSKNIELNANVVELGDVNSNILFATNTVLTAGNITGNVDFQNHDGTVILQAGKRINGSVTSTGTGDAKGTLVFLGIGEVTDPITKLKMLRAGAGEVRLAGGNYNITEIQGNGNNNLIFANNFNLEGSINSTGGTAVGLIFKGNNRVTGVVGTATSPVGTIQVQGTTVFGDKVQTANDQDIIISAGATAEFANSVTTRDIKGAADGQGTVQFSNAEAITVNSAIAVDTLEIARKDVEITQAVSANYISFSNTQEATLTLRGTSTVDSIRTVGNNVHTLELAADFTTRDQYIGLENNRLKSIELLGDHKITINSGVYSDISTKTDNTGKVVFNSDRSFAYNLGTDKLRLSDVTFANNATVKGDVYSKQITIASDKTATFAGTTNRTISVPNFTVDGSSLSRSLRSFAYSTQIVSDEIKNEGIAKFDKAVLVDAKITGGKVTFADNVWFKQTADGKEVNFAANKYVILEQNINFANIKADQAKIIILPKTASITGNLAAKDFTVDLAANQLKYTGQAQLTGKIELVTAYDTSSGAGGNIEVQKDSKLDLSKADELTIKVKAQTDINKIPKEGAKYVVISSVNGNGLVAIDHSKIKLDPTGEQNRFVQWSMDSSDLKLYITDISKEVIAKEIADKSTSQENREFYTQLNNVTDRNSSAAQFMNNIGQMDKEHAIQAMDRILPGNEHPIGESLVRNPTSEIIGGLIAQADIQITATRMGNSVPMQNAASAVDSENATSAIGSGDDDTLRYGVWGSPFYGTACQETYKGVSGYKSKSAGGIVGFDGLVNDNLLLGAAYSRINTQMSHQDKKIGDKTNGKTNIFSLYSLYNLTNNWFTEAIASYGITRVKNSEGRLIATTKRNVTALETAAAKYKSISYSGQLLTGYNYIASEKLMITPTIGFRYSQFKDAGYTETGTKFQNLVVKKRSYNKFEGILGLRTAATLKANKVLLIPELHGYVNHDFKGKAPIIDARLDGINEPLPTKSVKPVKTFFTVGTGFTAKYNMMECGIIYNVNIASKYIGHQGSLKVKVNF